MSFLQKILNLITGRHASEIPSQPVTGARQDGPKTPLAASERSHAGEQALDAWLAKLLEAGFRTDILDRQPYEEALNRAAGLGESAIPTLLRYLGQSEYVAFALGMIGGTVALEALGREIVSSDWRRVAAAATGLGLSKDPAAERYLKLALGGSLDCTVAEVHSAIQWAMNELYKSSSAKETPKVDRENIWRQIQSIETRFPDSAEWQRVRENAIALCRAIMQELPSISVHVPGYSYPPNEAKARAWGSLAPQIYYLLNPGTSVMNKPCPEARQCYEQALKLEPGDNYWEKCIREVS